MVDICLFIVMTLLGYKRWEQLGKQHPSWTLDRMCLYFAEIVLTPAVSPCVCWVVHAAGRLLVSPWPPVVVPGYLNLNPVQCSVFPLCCSTLLLYHRHTTWFGCAALVNLFALSFTPYPPLSDSHLKWAKYFIHHFSFVLVSLIWFFKYAVTNLPTTWGYLQKSITCICGRVCHPLWGHKVK